LLFFCFFILIGQNESPILLKSGDKVKLVFYNVENLFDTRNDSLKNDDEFLPESDRHWDNHKMYAKLNSIYRVLMGIGEWEPPAIVGLCEIENRFVLNQLIYQTPLNRFDYKVIHFDSPDARGIDVGMIYRNSLFQPDTSFAIPVLFTENADLKTRDILYVKGIIGGIDTLHLFINHWPSRYGGYMATISKRNDAANILRKKVDSVFRANKNANILLMGDFNDGLFEESLLTELNAKTDSVNIGHGELYNLMTMYSEISQTGTLKYREGWDIFDQIIVSSSLINNSSNLRVSARGAQIYSADYLIEADEKYFGEKPFRTYIGMKYNGGFSDHLPVYVELDIK